MIGEDGVTHINVYSKAKTELGKWLSNFAESHIETEDGHFNSIEGYWYWLKTGAENLRELSGYKAKEYGKTMPVLNVQLSDGEFSEKIKTAIDIKLKTYPGWSRNLAQTTLPLTHYYVYGSKRVEAGYEWIIDHIELRRKQLKEFYGYL